MESWHLPNLSVQIAPDCISEYLNFKNFPGGHARGPPSKSRLRRSKWALSRPYCQYSELCHARAYKQKKARNAPVGYCPHASGEFVSVSAYFKIPSPEWKKNPITCGGENSDIFESDDVAKSCPVSYRTKNQYGGTTCRSRVDKENFPYRALYGACSEDILVLRGPGYYSESEYHRKRVDGRIRFEYGTCGRRNF